MGEMSKQVRVDNWGTFFLQRLQAYFNKTEYCDLTLQFEGNVQLKVHRLVLYACTEYFHVLEQTCDVTDENVLIMPPDLQADVIVPIVNFMYTGMLEFQISMFDKLYQAATLMNIAILTKLLDAQRIPYYAKNSAARRHQERKSSSPHHYPHHQNKSNLPPTLPGRKLPVWKRKVAPSTHQEPAAAATMPLVVKPRGGGDPLAIFDNTPKPTRFEWPDEELTSFNPLDSTFDDISYTSKPLLTEEDELKACSEEKRAAAAAAKSSGGKPKGGSLDGNDEQKIRLDFEDDDESVDSDLISFESPATKRKLDNISPTSSTSSSSKRVRFNLGEKENKEKRLSITTSGKTADMDHTKIISELLKKYPDLVKKNKNIRLKIMSKNSDKTGSTKSPNKVRVQLSPKQTVIKVDVKKDEGPWICELCSTKQEKVEFVLYYLYRKHMTDVHNEKFDSRMCKFCGHKSNKHNMLMYHMYTKHGVKPPAAYNFPKCIHCNYIALTEALLIKHTLNHTKMELQCRECKIAFNTHTALENHVQMSGHTGKYGRTSYDCQYCTKQYQSGVNLFRHIRLQHRDEARRDGIVSIDESDEVAAVDGDDEETIEIKEQLRDDDEYITPEILSESKSKEKFKILQNVKVPVVPQQQQQQPEQQDEIQQQQQQQTMTLEPSSEAEALSNVASGIATSLGLVDIVVLNDNQQYIIQSNDQLHNNQPEFILPELNTTQFTPNQTIPTTTTATSTNPNHNNVIAQSMLNTADIASTDELVMVLTDHDYGDGNSELITNDNSNIVVLYSHPVDGQENQFITTSQGNLMVNSQTGMLEIRNTPITTTTANTIVVTQAAAAAAAAATPIDESIEMIQQEINSHASNAMQQEGGESDQQQQQQFVGEMEGHGDGGSTEVEGGGDDDDKEEGDASEEMAENYAEEQTQNEEFDAETEQQQQHEQEEEEEAENPTSDDVDANLVQENCEDAAPQLTAELDGVEEPNITGKDLEMPVLEEEETAQNEDENPADESEEKIADDYPDQSNEDTQMVDEENLQTDSQMIDEEKQREMMDEEQENCEEHSQPANEMMDEENSQPANQLMDEENSQSDHQMMDEENSQSSSHSSMRQQEFDEPVPATKCSILDDWEDTDSQQSEQSRIGNNKSSSGNTVNKLMDDWADEEDDESKRTVN